MIRSWRLDDGTRSLLLVAEGDALPQAVHWGTALPADGAEALWRAQAPDLTGGMLDAYPALSLSPEASRSFPGQPGLVVPGLLPRFAYAGEETETGRLVLRYVDAAHGLTLAFHFALAHDVLTARTVLDAERPLDVHWLAAPVLPGPVHGDHMIDFSGRWCGEFQPNRVAWTPGAHLRESRTGRSGPEHFPGLYLPDTDTTNTRGDCHAQHYGWSGGHRMVAEELPCGRRQVQWGHASGTAAPARRHETAPLYATWSPEGMNGCAVAFQRLVRDRIVIWPKPDVPRPVHYNCWEAVYFDHDPATLGEIAARAAALGAERFVLDDGWFGGDRKGRDDDTSSLGDWRVDPRKWPDGLGPLVERVHALGMTFGLWFEPEMVNLDSDLARAHPDWILGPADQVEGRQQRVLDMNRAEVRDHLHVRISAILSAHAIDYVKWDHNRVLPVADAAQARGTYALLDRLRADFPRVEIESCASGGGRIDYGILERTARVWLSDSNDALERLRIQHDAALFLPMAVTGAHVGPRRCHTSGRVLDMRLRAWVAAQRHMGFEMDPRELDADEAAVLAGVTAWWKANRGWMRDADILRLDGADPAVLAEEQLAADGGRFVVFAGRLAASARIAPRPLRLTRLEPAARYRVTLLNRDDAPALSRGRVALRDEPVEASGDWLMRHGLALPWNFPATLWVVEGERL